MVYYKSFQGSFFIDFSIFFLIQKKQVIISPSSNRDILSIAKVYTFIYNNVSDYMEFVRDVEKDEIIRNRSGGMGIGFEDIAKAIQLGYGVDKGKNDSTQYSHQGMLIVEIGGYPYKVPYYRQPDGVYRLITAYPSRKHKSYL